MPHAFVMRLKESLTGAKFADATVHEAGRDSECFGDGQCARVQSVGQGRALELAPGQSTEVAGEPLLSRAAILVVVAIGITVLVYGVVALIIRMDDFGLHLAGRSSPTTQKIGHGLVKGMPGLLTVISVVGTAAMIWVGGHIVLVGLDDLGWHAPYAAVHHVEVLVHDAVDANAPDRGAAQRRQQQPAPGARSPSRGSVR